MTESNPSRVIHYTNGGVRVKEDEFQFTISSNPTTTNSTRAITYRRFNNLPAVANRYLIWCEWSYPEFEYTRYFDASGTTVQVEMAKQYVYDNPDHLQITKAIETNSDDTQRITEFKYAHEIAGYETMGDDVANNQKHMISQLYSITVKKGANDVESKKWTTWRLDNGYWRPNEEWVWKGDGSTNDLTAPADPVDAETQRLTTYNTYDDYGNLEQSTDAHDVPTPTTTLWGYNASLPIARFGNAASTQVMTSVFDDGNSSLWIGSYGSWEITSGVFQQTDGVITTTWDNPNVYYYPGLDDAVLEADVRFDESTAPKYLAVAKWLNSTNFVRFELRRTTTNPVVRIHAKMGSANSTLDAAKILNANQWYHLRGEIQGSIAKLYLDGELLVTLNSSNVDHGPGYIGLCTYATKASFDNVRFYPPTALAFSTSYDPKFLSINLQTDESGHSLLYSYDAFGRLVSSLDRAGNFLSSFSYFYSRSASSNDTFDDDNPNYVREQTYRSGNELTTTTTYTDGLGRKIQTQIRKGTNDIVQHFTYDNLGRTDKVYNPFEKNTSHLYLPASQIPSGTCFEDTDYEPNPLNRVSLIVPFCGNTNNDIEFAYGTATFDGVLHRFTQTSDENEKVKKEYFDKFGNRIAVVAAEGTGIQTTTRFTYDILGNLKQTQAPIANDVTVYNYNPRSQTLDKTSTDIGTVKYRYDKNGNLRFQQDANQAATTNFTYFKYDKFNRVIEEGEWPDASIFNTSSYYENPDWPSQSQAGTNWKIRRYYDVDYINAGPNYSLGRLTKTEVNIDTDSNVEVLTRFRYDRFGRAIEKREQIEGLAEKVSKFEYDLLGNVVKTTYPSGRIVDRKYNEQNQLYTVKVQ
jgi:hypothetical protein